MDSQSNGRRFESYPQGLKVLRPFGSYEFEWRCSAAMGIRGHPLPPDWRHGLWARTGLVATALALTEEPERAAAVLVRRPVGRPLVLFGAVLPWRGDKRHGDVRGGKAFVRSLQLQAADWSRARSAVPGAELCVAGDFNQEFGACGPVGTQLGCKSFAETLAALDLRCVTGGEHDPLSAREWRASIDHILLSPGLRAEPDPKIWPAKFPLSSTLSDHYGVCLRVADA